MCGQCGCEQAPALKRLDLHQGLLSRNNTQAAHNRAHFQAHGLRSLNLLSAPGSGKTALLEQLAQRWPRPPIGVIVGDLATDNDARRLHSAGARAVQIRTGDLCHLDAALVHQALHQLDCRGLDLLVIENVGNLVCPAAFDLGEERRLALLNKIDLAEAVGFDRDAAIANLRAIAPQAELFELSARSGAGLDALIQWIDDDIPPA